MKAHRFSHKAVQRLVSNAHEVVAFGLKEGEISGVTIDTELVQYEDIHTITLYLNPAVQEDYYEYIFSLQPERRETKAVRYYYESKGNGEGKYQ